MGQCVRKAVSVPSVSSEGVLNERRVWFEESKSLAMSQVLDFRFVHRVLEMGCLTKFTQPSASLDRAREFHALERLKLQ